MEERVTMRKCICLMLTCMLLLGILPSVKGDASDTSDANVGGLQYANWQFGQGNLKEVHVIIQIQNDPVTNDGIYVQAYNAFINGRQFYFGLQTRTSRPPTGSAGRGLVFSQFGTTDSASIHTAPDGWYEVGTYEGPFISTRCAYPWTNHEYEMIVKYRDSDLVGDWYECWIADLTASGSTLIGALRFAFPSDHATRGISDGGGTWTERYYSPAGDAVPPEFNISILEVAALAENGALVFPKSVVLKIADNFYHVDEVLRTESDRLDFLIGGNATKSFSGNKTAILGTGAVSVAAKLNGSPWTGPLQFILQRERSYQFASVPQSCSDVWTSSCIVSYLSGGPPDATLCSAPVQQQALTGTGTATFVLSFVSRHPVMALQVGSTSFTVNGVSSTLDSPPVIRNARTLLPIRAIIEALGGTVDWDATTRKATVALQDTTLQLWIGKNMASVNGTSTPIDSSNGNVVPEIINGRTMLPLRFVAENLGCEVQWDAASQTITITGR